MSDITKTKGALTVKFRTSAWDRFLVKVKRRASDTERGKIAKKIWGPIVEEDVLQHFDDEEGRMGGWDARAVDTGNKILDDTSFLRRSVSGDNLEVSKNKLTWLNDAETPSGFPYGRVHDEGSTLMPQREFMWLSDEALDDISQATLDFLLDK